LTHIEKYCSSVRNGLRHWAAEKLTYIHCKVQFHWELFAEGGHVLPGLHSLNLAAFPKTCYLICKAQGKMKSMGPLAQKY
jgi:hypothetical protein